MIPPFPILPAILVLSSTAALGAEEPRTLPEYVTKAKIIRLLLDYVEWPSPGGRPLVVGVLEPSPFGDSLAQALEKSVIKGRPVQLRILRNPSQLPACDVVFLPENYEGSLEGVVRLLRGKPILTIGDSAGYAHRGLIVNLVLQDNRTRLEINLSAMKASGVAISPQVLKSAILIE